MSRKSFKRSKKAADRQSKKDSILKEVGHELKVNEPKIVGHTRRKFGAKKAEAQKKAILLSKARELGAKIKKK